MTFSGKRRVAVVLSGCGHLDGSEIQEAVAVFYHVARLGADYECFAPDREATEYDHRTGRPTGARRNVLREAARLARGRVEALMRLDANQFDAVIFPGGFGAARNLSDFASKGAAATALPEVVQAVKLFCMQQKPIGVICIAPAMLAAALKETSVRALLTLGETSTASASIESLGARHQACAVDDIVVDQDNRIVSSPAYMYDANVSEVFTGIGKLVEAVLALVPSV
jgi:enhancing lycopene biosynthesis protein 2